MIHYGCIAYLVIVSCHIIVGVHRLETELLLVLTNRLLFYSVLMLNVFERKVYRRILGPVYDNKKENCRILTNKEIYATVKKRTIRDNKVK